MPRGAPKIRDAEARVIALERRLLAAEYYGRKLAARAGTHTPTPTTSGNRDVAFFCRPTVDFSPANGYPGAPGASPSILPNQTIYRIKAQVLTLTTFVPASEVVVNSSATIYNAFNDLAPANQPILVLPNPDGTYTVANRNQDWCGYGNCLFPQKNLTLSWAINNLITGAGLGSGPLTYMGNCTYVANCLNTTNNVASTKFTMVVSQSCTYVQASYYRGANCAAGTGLGTLIYDDPNGCSGIFGGQLNLNHFTCSPLLYQWISVVGNPAWTVSL